MRSVIPMRIAKVGYLIISVAMSVLGVWLIVAPGFPLSLLGYLFGAMLIVFGIVRLVGYFSKDLFRLAFQYDLAFGILMLALGILTLVNPGGLMNFICLALGISVLTDSIFKVRISLDARKFGIRKWWLILGFAMITGILGLVLMFRPGAGSHLLAVLLGIALLSEGMLNISTVVTAVKIIKHQKPDIIEAEYEESEEKTK